MCACSWLMVLNAVPGCGLECHAKYVGVFSCCTPCACLPLPGKVGSALRLFVYARKFKAAPATKLGSLQQLQPRKGRSVDVAMLSALTFYETLLF